MSDHSAKMNQLLDNQLTELENRFNQFLKELEEDFNFVPSVLKQNKHDQYWEYDNPAVTERLASMERRYAEIDKKYTWVLALTSLLAFGAVSYLAYVVFAQG